MSQVQPSLSSLAPPGTYKMSKVQSTKISTIPSEHHDHHAHGHQDQHQHGFGFGWLGLVFLWLIILLMLFWIILYSLNPAFVQNADNGAVDTAKVLLWAFIFAVIVVIILWIIYAIMHRKRC